MYNVGYKSTCSLLSRLFLEISGFTLTSRERKKNEETSRLCYLPIGTLQSLSCLADTP